MAKKTSQPSDDETPFRRGRRPRGVDGDTDTIFAPSNTGDPSAPRPPSRLQLSDFHSLVRSSSAAIACVEFPEPVSPNGTDAQSFSERLFSVSSKCLEASDSFARLRGLNGAAELINKPLRALLPPELGHDSLITEWHRRSLTSEGFEWTLVDIEQRPSLFHVALYANLGAHGISRVWIVLRDISPLARAITAVTKTERHYRNLLDRQDILSIRVYPDGAIANVTKASEREFKISTTSGTAIDEILSARCHPEDREGVERLSFHRRALSLTPLTVRIRLIGDTSGLSTYEVTQHPHTTGDEVDYFDLIGVRVVESTERSPTDILTAGFVHDSNNHLLIASSAIESAQRHLPPGHPSRESLEAALASIRQCSAINAQTIRISAGVRWRPEAIDILELFSQVTRQCGAALPRGVTLRSSPAQERVFAWADRVHLTQILVNLILNARDALGTSGAITLSVTRKGTSPMTTPHSSGHQVCVSVSDNGSGIPERIRDNLFKPFVSTKGAQNTRGLGLTMVMTLIERNGGEVTVTSAQGLGTTFTLSLPEAEAPADTERRSLSSNSPSEPRHDGLRVVIADDEPEIRKTLISSLVAHGAEALAVPDAPSLLEEISRAKPGYDLVILDDGMPGSTAATVCEALHKVSPRTAILVTSGDAAVGDALRSPHVQGFLAKPFSLADLHAAIEHAFPALARRESDKERTANEINE